jgi:hypothetical protein
MANKLLEVCGDEAVAGDPRFARGSALARTTETRVPASSVRLVLVLVLVGLVGVAADGRPVPPPPLLLLGSARRSLREAEAPATTAPSVVAPP